MKLTPEERRQRMDEIASQDENWKKMMEEYLPAKKRFTKFVDRLPKPLRELLWRYPGMGYFLHHRMLNLVAEHMRFEDEE